MRITEHGELVRFEGGVSMTLKMDPPSADAAAQPEPAAEPEAAPAEPAKPRAVNGKRANAK
jgi:lipopolysaccharide export system protein LptC